MQTAAQISHRKGENKMKKLFMVCNAHLDPVWLWNWQEGAAAAIATFRTAADICEESEGFVFCHNEALLYSWVEEYEPALFQRIRRLVEAKKWHIMGGWYLQPDCNLPSGDVLVLAEGAEDKLRQLEISLNKGPLFARVDSVKDSPEYISYFPPLENGVFKRL